MNQPADSPTQVASIVLAAGRGSRMRGYDGAKCLLPLVPADSPFRGTHPILLHILDHLPPGPKALVLHHGREEVIRATRNRDVVPCLQPVLNGTGGALLSARSFLELQGRSRAVIITMGDVPFVAPQTYLDLLAGLRQHPLVVLGFRPRVRKQYGVLEIRDQQVLRIIEWKYWQGFPPQQRAALTVCNAGIYAARNAELLEYLGVLASRPHRVTKEVAGRQRDFEEFFITDLVESMAGAGLAVGYIVAGNEEEVMGIDDLEALQRAQRIFAAREKSGQPERI